MIRSVATAFALTVSLSLGASACKKDEAKPESPPVEPIKAPEAEKIAEVAKPGDPTGGGKLLAGIDKHAFSSAGKSLDGVANFGFGSGPAGDAKGACEQYGKDVASFLGDLQSEYKALQDNMDSQGADALARFGDFLVKSGASLKGLKIGHPDLASAHGEFTVALEAMGGGFNEAASAVRAKDEPGAGKAIEKVQAGAGQLQAAFAKIEKVCGS
jgi:hypothetical protein